MINFNVDTQLKNQLNGFRANQFKKLYLNDNISYVQKVLPLVALGDFLLRLVTRVALVTESLFKGFCNLATGEFSKGAGQFFYGTGRNIFMLLPDALYGIYLIFTGIHFNVHGATVKSEISVRWGALDPIGRGEQRTMELRAQGETVLQQRAAAVEKARANETALIQKGERGECTGAEYFTLAMMYNGGSCTTTAPDQNKYWEYVVKASEAGYTRAMELVGLKKMQDQQAEESAAAEARAKAAAEARAKAAFEAEAAREAKAAREVAEFEALNQLVSDNPHDGNLLYKLGGLFLHGIGTPKYPIVAINCYEKAANLGNPNAQAFLKRNWTIAPLNESSSSQSAQLVAAAEKEKEELEANLFNGLMQKYESGEATPAEIYQISQWYRYGYGVNVDGYKAEEFRIKAIELLYVPAMEHVAPHLITVKLARHVVSEFIPLYLTEYNAVRPFVEVIAEEEKNPVAMLYVGYSYAQQGNWDEAKTWFRKLSLVAQERHSDRGRRLTLAVDEHQKRLAGTIPHGHTQYPKLKNLFTSLDAGILNFEAQETKKLFPTYSKVRESLNKSWD